MAPLENLLVDTEWPLRAAAADALGDLGRLAVGSVPLLQRALSDSAVWVRRNATEALGHMGSDGSEAVPALAERLNDPDLTVRHNATGAGKDRTVEEGAAGALQAAQRTRISTCAKMRALRSAASRHGTQRQ